MEKKFGLWVVFRWEDFLGFLKDEEFTEGDIVFIVDTPLLTGTTLSLTENVKAACRKKNITLIEDYEELQSEIYKRKREFKDNILSEVVIHDRRENEESV